MKYKYCASERFWHEFYALLPAQKEAVRKAWRVFRDDPFDSRLRTHKIHTLSAAAGQTVRSVVIEGDLRAVFVIEGDTVYTLDIGAHAIYR